MSLLFRYLTKNNAMILLPTLAVGIGLYVLTDLFERLDNFIEAGLSVGMVLTYFVVKMPLVISQILPVIFLLSTVIQLCIMARSRELTALQAGGISLGVVANSMRHFLGRRPAWFLRISGRCRGTRVRPHLAGRGPQEEPRGNGAEGCLVYGWGLDRLARHA